MHAGLVPGVPLEQQQLTNLFKMRHVAQAANGSYAASEEGASLLPWGSVWKGPQHVFFGHDAKRRLQDLPSATGVWLCCIGWW